MRKGIEFNLYLLGMTTEDTVDCALWERVLTQHCRIYELRNKEKHLLLPSQKFLLI